MAMVRLLAIAGLASIILTAASAQPASLAPRPAGTPEDEAAIRTIVNHWQQTWDRFDASFLEGDFAEDADWLNAFGVKIQGSSKILAFMAGMVKRPTVQGRKTTWDEPRIRFVRSDVALAYRDYRTVGHKTLDGKEMPQRNTHATWFLTKDGGKWRISSQVIYDDNSGPAPQ
jgi:uncharacterized protein (TIGR02246 family)